MSILFNLICPGEAGRRTAVRITFARLDIDSSAFRLRTGWAGEASSLKSSSHCIFGIRRFGDDALSRCLLRELSRLNLRVTWKFAASSSLGGDRRLPLLEYSSLLSRFRRRLFPAPLRLPLALVLL